MGVAHAAPRGFVSGLEKTSTIQQKTCADESLRGWAYVAA